LQDFFDPPKGVAGADAAGDILNRICHQERVPTERVE
jgi:hypothetical protein